MSYLSRTMNIVRDHSFAPAINIATGLKMFDWVRAISFGRSLRSKRSHTISLTMESHPPWPPVSFNTLAFNADCARLVRFHGLSGRLDILYPEGAGF